MARYVDPTGNVWSIERDFARVITRSGKRKLSDKTHATPLVARFHERMAIAQKMNSEGFRRVDEAPTTVDEFPFDSDARLVHADILQQRGDPLGELIVMQHRGVDTRSLLEAHAKTWFGDLADVQDQFRFTWRLGRLSRVEIRPDEGLDPHVPGIPYPFKLSVLIHPLFELPIASAVEDLVVGSVATNDHQATMFALNVCAPPYLRRLEIVANKRLGRGGLSSMRLPTLEEFDCEVELGKHSLGFVADAECPKLHTLSIRLEGAEEGVFLLPKEVRDEMRALKRIFARPALRHVEVWTSTPDVVAQTLKKAAPSHLTEVVIRSKRAIESNIVLPPYARFDQQPLYSMRP